MNTTLTRCESAGDTTMHGEAPQRALRPRADIYEAEDAWFLVLELPGVDEQGTDVSLEKNVLSVTGVVEAFDTEGFDRHDGKFAGRRFERSFRLPDEVDTTAVEAHVKSGVLRLRLPKAEAARPHKVVVNAG